jgi:type I restriction enzyme, S subunit
MEATIEEAKVKKYPAYKDSGTNWLGEIPTHWEVVRSKRLFQQRKERARKEDQQLTASQKFGIINQQEFMELEGRRVTQVF